MVYLNHPEHATGQAATILQQCGLTLTIPAVAVTIGNQRRMVRYHEADPVSSAVHGTRSGTYGQPGAFPGTGVAVTVLDGGSIPGSPGST